MIDRIGWIGSLLLATCGLPELFFAIQNKQVNLSYTFLIWWGIGEIFVFAYTLAKSKHVHLLPLLFNYGFNIVVISILVLLK